MRLLDWLRAALARRGEALFGALDDPGARRDCSGAAAVTGDEPEAPR